MTIPSSPGLRMEPGPKGDEGARLHSQDSIGQHQGSGPRTKTSSDTFSGLQPHKVPPLSVPRFGPARPGQRAGE